MTWLIKRLQKFVVEFREASWFDRVTFIFGVLAAAGLLFEHGLLHTGIIKSSAGVAADCSKMRPEHVINFENNQFVPNSVEAKLCDRIKFVNFDDTVHEPALGHHPVHLNYPGFTERGLLQGDSNEFTLSVAGEFPMHDHLNETIEGEITVTK